MWTRIFTVLLPCFLLFSCDHGCSVQEQQQAHADMAEAYSSWKGALNYMDERIILSAFESFTDCTEEAAQCIGVDTAALSEIEIISKVYMESDPDSKRIEWAEERISELDSLFAASHQN